MNCNGGVGHKFLQQCMVGFRLSVFESDLRATRCNGSHEDHPTMYPLFNRQIDTQPSPKLTSVGKVKFVFLYCEEPGCKFMTRHRATLNWHKNTVHRKVRKYKCSVCPQSYVTAYHLKRHMQSHKDPRFDCPTCGQRFVREDSRRFHMKLHSANPQPYDCHLCGAKFSQKGSANRHIRLMHKVLIKQSQYSKIKSL